MIAELAAAPVPGTLPPGSRRAAGAPRDLTISEVLAAFKVYADAHYRRTDGTPTNTVTEYGHAAKVLRELYGHTPAKDFGPLVLKAVRSLMLERGWCRTTINDRVGKIKRMFKWAAGEELVPPSVPESLRNVAGLQKGRTAVSEPDPVGPVDPAWVEATLPHLTPTVAAIVEVEMRTGTRPGEVCRLRPMDLDTSGEVWVYRPDHHKTTHRGKPRAVPLGPRCRDLLRAFWPADPSAHVFRPGRAAAERRAARAANRKTKAYPSHVRQNEKRREAAAGKTPKRSLGGRYSTRSYYRAVQRAAERAGVGYWHPNQLRHLHATEVRRLFGLEAARTVLGHETAHITTVYAERDLTLAASVAAELG